MFLLTPLFVFTRASVRSEWLSNLEAYTNPNELLEKGVLFHERSKILLAEKFVRVEFLVPFPTYYFDLKPEIELLLDKLSDMWALQSIFCPLNFSTQFSTNSSSFNVQWMLRQIESEITDAQLDVEVLRNETSMFLSHRKRVNRHAKDEEARLVWPRLQRLVFLGRCRLRKLRWLWHSRYFRLLSRLIKSKRKQYSPVVIFL